MHPKRPPEVFKLIATLTIYDVRYVLVGSVAATLYGVETVPGDLDITPALDRGNLLQLAGVLEYLEAKPSGAVGHWKVQPNGEHKWISDGLTPEEVAAFREAWRLEPDNLGTLDQLFTTRHGNLDVVPEIAGLYDCLRARATPLQVFEREVFVANVDDLLATVTVPRREKDLERVVKLREVQRTRYKYPIR